MGEILNFDYRPSVQLRVACFVSTERICLKILRILFCVFLVTVVCSHYAVAAKVIIKVVDEEGQPIEGAKVGVGFNYNTGEGTNTEGQQGLSNVSGTFEASGQGNGHVTYGANKEGYYNSHYAYDFKKTGPLGWEPRNPELTVMLREIGTSLPMYARDANETSIEIPIVDKEVGFDLTKFDWVVPHGSGIHSDFIFYLKRQFVAWNEQNCELTVTFANKHDGILHIDEDLQYGSIFKLPRFAPENGYQDNLALYIKAGSEGYKTNVKRTDNYIFRIRSKEDDDKVVKAMYGKIIGALDFSPIGSKTGKIYFKYYLNPDGMRNLEFDPKRNLFTGLAPREWVGIK